MKKLGIFAVAVMFAFALSPALHGSVQAQGQGQVVTISLIDQNNSGEDGAAQVTSSGASAVQIVLTMINAPAGADQPAFIQEGTCAAPDADTLFTLQDVTGGKSTSTVQAALADLTNSPHIISVRESDADKDKVISCGNFPSAAEVSAGPLTIGQVMTTLLSQANDILSFAKKSESDSTSAALKTFMTTFEAHEADIRAQNASAQQSIEDAMHEVNNELTNKDLDGAADAAQELVAAVQQATAKLNLAAPVNNSSTEGASGELVDEVRHLQTAANEIQDELNNNDMDGAKQASQEFHDSFAAIEDELKASDADAQEHIEDAMNEVADALTAGDAAHAKQATTELLNEVNDALSELNARPSVPKTGAPAQEPWLPLAAAGLALLLAGGALRRRGATVK